MKPIRLVLLGLTFALATSLAVRAALHISRTEAAMALLVVQRADLQAKVSRTEEDLRVASAACVKLKETSATAKTASPRDGASKLSPETIIAGNPVKLAAFCRDFREGLTLDYVRAQPVVGLTEQQIERLKDIRVRALQRTMEVRAAAETGKIGNEQLRMLERADAEEQMKQEATALGDCADRYREFLHTSATRKNYVERLAACELYGDAPLNADQIESATRILAGNSQQRPDGGIVSAAVDWDVASSQLRGIISPAQIIVLQQFCQMTLLNHQVDQEIDDVIAQVTSAPRH